MPETLTHSACNIERVVNRNQENATADFYVGSPQHEGQNWIACRASLRPEPTVRINRWILTPEQATALSYAIAMAVHWLTEENANAR